MLYTDGEKVFYFLLNTQIKTKRLNLLKHESGGASALVECRLLKKE